MGSRIVLTADQQHPFRIGLKKLSAILNDSAQFEDLLARGIHRITVVADLGYGHFKKLFATPAFLRWANGSEERGHNRSFLSRFQEYESDQQRENAREALLILRDTLNDKSKYEALVKIGPCAFTLCWDDEQAYDEDTPILISNFIPDHWPNADYSIRSNGEVWFHS